LATNHKSNMPSSLPNLNLALLFVENSTKNISILIYLFLGGSLSPFCTGIAKE
jgi:hypothetical protein